MTAARHSNYHVDLAAYRPLPDDEDGLTPRQVAECRAATRRAMVLRYDCEMTEYLANTVLAYPDAVVMERLELDADQVEDVRVIARRHLERLERDRKLLEMAKGKS